MANKLSRRQVLGIGAASAGVLRAPVVVGWPTGMGWGGCSWGLARTSGLMALLNEAGVSGGVLPVASRGTGRRRDTPSVGGAGTAGAALGVTGRQRAS